MAEEANTPVTAAEPPKMNPLGKPVVPGVKTVKLAPVVHKPGATVAARPLIKPVIRKPGATGAALPKPVLPKPVTPAPAPAAAEAPAPAAEAPKPMETLKTVTQKLKGTTQPIPAQAILHKTGIIADGSQPEALKTAAKSKTSRISLSSAIGAAPVKNEAAPMKTIKIRRPAGIAPAPAAAAPAPAAPGAEPAAPAAEETDITQRKTLKVACPGAAVRPAGKFSIHRPGAEPAAPAATPAAPAADGAVADIADIPEMPLPTPTPTKAVADEGPAWLVTLSTVIQIAACLAMGALGWFLFQSTQIAYF